MRKILSLFIAVTAHPAIPQQGSFAGPAQNSPVGYLNQDAANDPWCQWTKIKERLGLTWSFTVLWEEEPSSIVS